MSCRIDAEARLAPGLIDTEAATQEPLENYIKLAQADSSLWGIIRTQVTDDGFVQDCCRGLAGSWDHQHSSSETRAYVESQQTQVDSSMWVLIRTQVTDGDVLQD